LWDVLPDERKLGGAPANLSYRLTGLGNPTFLLTRLGDDKEGNEALDLMKKRGLRTDFIQTDKEYPTGTVDVYFDADKNPDYTINAPAAYDFITWNEALDNLAASVDCMIFGTLVQRSEQTATTLHRLVDRAEKATKFYDVNLRKACYSQPIIERSMTKAHIVKLNHREADELGLMFGIREKELPLIARKLVDQFHLDYCVVTLEEKGALAVEKGGHLCYSPGYRVRMEDPLGAGDAFSAAFLDELLRTRDLFNALEAGNLYGAIVVGQQGAMEPITRKMIENISSSKHERVGLEEFRKYWRSPSESSKQQQLKTDQ